MFRKSKHIKFLLTSLVTLFSFMTFYSREVVAKSSQDQSPSTVARTFFYESISNTLSGKYTFLSKSFEVSPRQKILLFLTDSGKAIVNPRDGILPYTKNISEISDEDATKLFGRPNSSDAIIKHFKLEITNAPKYFRKKNPYILEAKFENGVLTSYRVSGLLISKPQNWVDVTNLKEVKRSSPCWGGVETGPRYIKWCQDWCKNNPRKKLSSLSERPHLVTVGISKWGNPIADIQEPDWQRLEYPNRFKTKGYVFGNRIKMWLKDWHLNNPGKKLKVNERPQLTVVGRTKPWGYNIFDLPALEPSQQY